jgi:hypothetical protein
VQLHPDDAFTLAVMGRVRRIVVDSAGVCVDAGRASRLFTGAMREALLAIDNRCTWLSCNSPYRLEADHLATWNDLGDTSTVNGKIWCRWHNNAKNRGFFARRDDVGMWHYHRPDGSEVIQV